MLDFKQKEEILKYQKSKKRFLMTIKISKRNENARF